MPEEQEEDLSKFDLQDLINIANEIAQQMAQGAERLAKVSSAIAKKTPCNVQKPNSPVPLRPPEIRSATPRYVKEIQGSRTKGLEAPRGRR